MTLVLFLLIDHILHLFRLFSSQPNLQKVESVEDVKINTNEKIQRFLSEIAFKDEIQEIHEIQEILDDRKKCFSRSSTIETAETILTTDE